jgi:hypothetical protein
MSIGDLKSRKKKEKKKWLIRYKEK